MIKSKSARSYEFNFILPQNKSLTCLMYFQDPSAHNIPNQFHLTYWEEKHSKLLNIGRDKYSMI